MKSAKDEVREISIVEYTFVVPASNPVGQMMSLILQMRTDIDLLVDLKDRERVIQMAARLFG